MFDSAEPTIRTILSQGKALGGARAAAIRAQIAVNSREAGAGPFPRKRSKKSVWKRLRSKGRNPGGYAQR